MGDRDGCIPISTSPTMTERVMQGISALRGSGDMTPFRTVAVSFVRMCLCFYCNGVSIHKMAKIVVAIGNCKGGRGFGSGFRGVWMERGERNPSIS